VGDPGFAGNRLHRPGPVLPVPGARRRQHRAGWPGRSTPRSRS
jgi:hypothetical protein